MIRGVSAILMAIAVAALSACVDQQAIEPIERLQSRASEAVLPYAFKPNTNDFSDTQRQSFRKFMADKAPRRSDWLVISVPKASSALGDQQRALALKRVFNTFPGRIELIVAEGFKPAIPARNQGVVKLIRAERPMVNCPQDVSAIGCASAYNLAQMLADPMDLRLSSTNSRYRPLAAPQVSP